MIQNVPSIYNGESIYNGGGGGGGGGTNPPLPGVFGRIYETDFSNFDTANYMDYPRIGSPVSYAAGGNRIEEHNGEKFYTVEYNSNIYGALIDISNASKVSFGQRCYTKIGATDGANIFYIGNGQQIIIDPYFNSPPTDFCSRSGATPRTIFQGATESTHYTNYFQLPDKNTLYNGGVFDIRIEADKTINQNNFIVFINGQIFSVGSLNLASFNAVRFYANSGRTYQVLGFTNCFVDVIE